MFSNLLLLYSFFLLLQSSTAYYSKYYRKCRVFNQSTFDLGSAPLERVPQYGVDFNFPQFLQTTKQIEYSHLDFIYDSYIDAGGSGEVYQIQDLESGKVRVLKRFFKENLLEFEQQNFVMNQMGYEMKWHKQDNNDNKSTMASYPSKESVVLRDLEIQQENQIAVVFYKICRQLDKAHKRGLIHDDMKMGNILISSVGQGLRTIQVQLIDWNLATFYSKGFQSNQKKGKGTICYYSPQNVMRTAFITPATDIWSLAIVYFSFITDKKPFTVNCKDSNFQAILTLVGSDRFLEVYQKYNKASAMEVTLIEQIKKNKNLYEGINIRDRIPQEYSKYFDDQLIDLFTKMLQPDPEYRLAITQVLNHPYFDRIKRLPKMYAQKNKKKRSEKKQVERHPPANNLSPPQKPQFYMQDNAI